LPHETLDLILTGPGILSSNAHARHLAGEFVQFQRNPEPLATRHLAVAFDLHFGGGFRTHGENLSNWIRAGNEEFAARRPIRWGETRFLLYTYLSQK
jgi:hypothetical protein